MNFLRLTFQIISFLLGILSAYVIGCATLVYVFGFAEPKAGGQAGTFTLCLSLTPTLALAAGAGFAFSLVVLATLRQTSGTQLRVLLSGLVGIALGAGFCTTFFPWALLFTSIQLALVVCGAFLGLVVDLASRAVERRSSSKTTLAASNS